MYKLVTLSFIIGCFLGPYLYIVDPKIQVLRIVTPLIFLFLFWKSKKISVELAYVVVFYSSYYFYTLAISIINFNIINFKDVFNFTYIPIIIITSILLIRENQKKFLNIFAKFLIWFSVINLIIAAYEEITLNHLGLSSMNAFPTIWDGYYHMPTTFYVNSNDFSVVYIMGIMFLLFYYQNSNNKFSNIFKLIIIISALWVVYITKSRISQVVFIIYLVVYIKIWKTPLKKIFYISLSLTLITLLFDFNVLEKIDVNFSPERSNSNANRLALYQSSFASIKESYGLGYGVNLSKHFYANVVNSTGGIVNPHSYLFELLINSGILFFSLYIILNAYLFIILLLKKSSPLIIAQFGLYNLLLFSSSSSLFLWPHYLFFIVYISTPRKLE